jgi:hypothetical protein
LALGVKTGVFFSAFYFAKDIYFFPKDFWVSPRGGSFAPRRNPEI